MATSDRVLIVGGGLAGLTAARRLALAGAEVTVLEASSRFGGQLATHTVGGITLDAGAEAFATRAGTVRACEAAGAGGHFLRAGGTFGRRVEPRGGGGGRAADGIHRHEGCSAQGHQHLQGGQGAAKAKRCLAHHQCLTPISSAGCAVSPDTKASTPPLKMSWPGRPASACAMPSTGVS